jgi:hypothetical protein
VAYEEGNGVEAPRGWWVAEKGINALAKPVAMEALDEL